MNDDLITPIQVEPRQLLLPKSIGMFITQDQEPGWNRSYSLWGWQRFPTFWLVEYTVPEKAEVLEWLREELLAKGYSCEFVTILEKETT